MKTKIKNILKPIFYKLPANYRNTIHKGIFYIRHPNHLKVKIKGKLHKGYANNTVNHISNGIDINNNCHLGVVSGDYSLLELFSEKNANKNFFIFPVIDWEFRIQRPQHLAREIAGEGNKVIYFTTTFNFSDKPGFKLLSSPEKNVLICQLNLNSYVNIYKDNLTRDQVVFLLKGLYLIKEKLNIDNSFSIIDLPFWTEPAMALPNNMVIYDCMDHHAGFENNSDVMLIQENILLKKADLVITTAQKLSDIIGEKRDNIIIRNAAEVDYFYKTERKKGSNNRKVIGYYGAIAEWFDIDLLKYAAKKLPDYEFLIIGNITTDLKNVDKLPNVKFTGEVKYSELTSYLKDIDVCLIPFQLIELTLCTNPVKVYEYLAAGKPVVSTAMPEVELMKDYVHIAYDQDDFVSKIKLAVNEINNEDLYQKRQQWALTQDWKSRAKELISKIDTCYEKLYPKVSLIVVTYNNLELTKNCLYSIEKNTYYPNYEVIVVDNCSTDGTPEYLSDNIAKKDNFKVILNKDNLGFAAGNNEGIKVADGEIIVLINNDTFVSPNWLSVLVKTLKNNKDLGLVCPVTNNIGNEAKINISYDDFFDMENKARNYTLDNFDVIYPVDNVAFFCVAIKREVINEAGLICTDYGLGFFEDDDYCARARKFGWKLAVVDGSFVHHHLSASFSKLKSDKHQELMKRNQEIYEKKWGRWIPHTYRNNVI